MRFTIERFTSWLKSVEAVYEWVHPDLECLQFTLQLFRVDFTVLSELTLLRGFGTRILQLRLQLSHTHTHKKNNQYEKKKESYRHSHKPFNLDLISTAHAPWEIQALKCLWAFLWHEDFSNFCVYFSPRRFRLKSSAWERQKRNIKRRKEKKKCIKRGRVWIQLQSTVGLHCGQCRPSGSS